MNIKAYDEHGASTDKESLLKNHMKVTCDEQTVNMMGSDVNQCKND